MTVRIPPSLRQALWRHQRDAVDAMTRYIAGFNSKAPRAALVHMPTGSGKTLVIASLARCIERSGPVVVVAPRVGLREQLARYIKKRAFEHAGVDAASLPRRVRELKDGRSHLGDLDDLVVVTTIQMLTSIRKQSRQLSDELQETAVLTLFDEGHYEPAAVWSQAVRGLPCPRIIFTATPFRDDFKLFDINPKHVYRYSFDRARRQRYVRDVRVYKRAAVRAPAQFAAEVVGEYDRLFGTPKEGDDNRPRVIIRCDKPEVIRQLASAVKNLGRSVIGIHETFNDNPTSGEYHKVPDPEVVKATFWVHQFKLLEGIDDPRFQLLALYNELRSMRAFVQQVGRVIRNPKRSSRAVGHVLDHSRRWRQTQLWTEFLAYDELIEQGGYTALDLNQRALVKTLKDAVPGLVYVDGRLRTPADIAQLDLASLQLPLSANLFDKPPQFCLADVREAIVRQCEEDDFFFHAPAPQSDTVVVFYVRVDSSPLLETGFFAEPKLGVSLVHKRGRYLFVFDSHAGLAANAVDATPVGRSRLRKLFVRAPGTRLTHVSTVNANPGADQVRARAMTAVSVEQVAPSFDEHGYVLRTATGYSRRRRGSDEDVNGKVRRYIGTESGRVSDLGVRFVPFDEWAYWTAELEMLLDGGRPTLQVFGRWASHASVPRDPNARNVLLDVSDVRDRYLTTGDDNVSAGREMELSELCAEVNDGMFVITANGKPRQVKIEFDPERQKYELSSPDLDRLYYSTDPENGEGLIRYMNRTQSLRVIPATSGYFYTLGEFYKPIIRFGPEYDDAKMGVLSSLVSTQELRRPMREKGERCRQDGSGWEKGCLFDLIDSLGKGTALAQHFKGTEVLVCDDLNDECADFILVQRATSSHRKRVVFIHAKASPEGSDCSAAALQDVCGQAQKNLREVSLFADPGPSKKAKWSRPWNGRPHTVGLVRRRIRRRLPSDPEEDIRRAVKDPTADREVWLMLGNLLSKNTMERLLRQGDSPPGYAIQAAYLLFSTITNVAAAGARLTAFCS
jgi:Type III restriction enzyme, res subunit